MELLIKAINRRSTLRSESFLLSLNNWLRDMLVHVPLGKTQIKQHLSQDLDSQLLGQANNQTKHNSLLNNRTAEHIYKRLPRGA